jgi:hypothetical protein
MQLVLHFIDRAEQAVAGEIDSQAIRDLPVLRKLQRASEEIQEDKPKAFRNLMKRVDEEFDRLAGEAHHAR